MYDLQQKAEAVVRADPAVVNVGSSIGTTGWNASVNRGNLFISLKPLAERGGITSQAVANRLRQKTADIPGLRVFFFPMQDVRVGGRQSHPTPVPPSRRVTRRSGGPPRSGLIRRINSPAVTISFGVAENTPIEQATRMVDQAVAELHIPDTLHAEYAGDARAFRQSIGAQPLLIVAALIAVYIVLGVLYESLAHPLTIISTLPSAGLGALLALQIFNAELTLIAFIGIILLIGIVKKNGIMLVDFALEAERTRGLPPERAIYEACLERFRPILMTTMASLLGAVPLVIAAGPGSELRRPLGITIIGGLFVSQMLT